MRNPNKSPRFLNQVPILTSLSPEPPSRCARVLVLAVLVGHRLRGRTLPQGQHRELGMFGELG